jgi:hypothetical protein
MSAIDRSDEHEPPHFTTGEDASNSSWQSRARRWNLMLLLWLVISLPLVYVVYAMHEPVYEAFSTLRIEPTKPELFGPAVRGMDATGFLPYLETQRNLILTDRVLEEALSQPSVQAFPLLKETEANDPKLELRENLSVTIIPDTYLIRVSYGSRNPNEAFAVVKEVVDAFLRQHREFNLGDTDSLKKQYEGYLEKLREQIEKKRAEMLELAAAEDKEDPKKPDVKRPSHVLDWKVNFLSGELNSLMSKHEIVERKLEQLRFESSNRLVRVFLQDKASPPKMPRPDNRMLYMALVPIVTCLTLLGLSLLLKVGERRRANVS